MCKIENQHKSMSLDTVGTYVTLEWSAKARGKLYI